MSHGRRGAFIASAHARARGCTPSASGSTTGTEDTGDTAAASSDTPTHASTAALDTTTDPTGRERRPRHARRPDRALPLERPAQRVAGRYLRRPGPADREVRRRGLARSDPQRRQAGRRRLRVAHRELPLRLSSGDLLLRRSGRPGRRRGVRDCHRARVRQRSLRAAALLGARRSRGIRRKIRSVRRPSRLHRIRGQQLPDRRALRLGRPGVAGEAGRPDPVSLDRRAQHRPGP